VFTFISVYFCQKSGKDGRPWQQNNALTHGFSLNGICRRASFIQEHSQVTQWDELSRNLIQNFVQKFITSHLRFSAGKATAKNNNKKINKKKKTGVERRKCIGN
jgi:hypothetical protein